MRRSLFLAVPVILALGGGASHAQDTSPQPAPLAAAEEVLIQRALQQTGGNIADAARLLGVHRTRIYRKLSMEGGKPGKSEDEGGEV